MANARTTAANLADEVAELLRHSNIDRRILDWLGTTFNDIVVRCGPCHLFTDWIEALAIGSNTKEEPLTADQEAALGSPILAIFVGNSNKLYTPEYRTPQDFDKLEKEVGGSAPTSGTIPLYWTISETAVADGRRALRWFPETTGAYTAWIAHTGRYLDDSPTGSSFFFLPYHWEHLLIWGAAAQGAAIVRPELADGFQMEYELALASFQRLMDETPDSQPVLKAVGGPYSGTSMMRRLPETITG